MTAGIELIGNAKLYGLIYPDHLSKLEIAHQEIMKRALHNSSQTWIGFDGPTILCFWGLIPPSLLSDQAYLWMYITEHFHEHTFVFIRHSRLAVEEMLKHYPVIIGHGKVGDRKSLQWLRWIGAKFGEPQGQLIPFRIEAR